MRKTQPSEKDVLGNESSGLRRSGDREAGPPGPGPTGSGSPGSGPAGSDPTGSGEQAPPGSGPPWNEETGSFGTWLRRQREGRDIDLREIAEESKISLGNLRAFEEDRFEILPAPVFAKGFLRQYARYVGLDPQEVINFYLSARQKAIGEEEEVESEVVVRESSSWKLGGLILAVAAVFAVLVWFLARWNEQQTASPYSGAATSFAKQREPDSTAIPEPPQVGEPGLEGSLRPESLTADPSDSESSSGRPGSADARSTVARSAAAGFEPPEPGSDEPDSPLRVTIDFAGECWVEASVDGERQVAENKIQGESLLLEASATVELTIGNIDAVQVEVNGLPFDFDRVPGTKVRTQLIDLETVEFLSGAQTRKAEGDTSYSSG